MKNSTLAFVFPGQGSQSLGMLADLAAHQPQIEATFAEASQSLQQDLWQLVQQGPEEQLHRTDITQPVLLAASTALWRVWLARGGARPAVLSGHSLGEYSALVAAGALDFKDAVLLVNKRGRYMQEAVPAGTGLMAAILGLSDDAIRAACEQAAQGEVVAPVNFNSPGQVVIAGHKTAVERAVAFCKEAGARRALPLAVSAPSHCELMRPAAEQLAEALKNIDIQAPAIPVVHNVSASVLTTTAEIKQALVEQLYRPILWTDCVNAMVEQGVTHIIECGPGKVLSGLNKRIEAELTTGALGDSAGLEQALSLAT